jgi:two-component system response regulator PilR (NtrC family)
MTTKKSKSTAKAGRETFIIGESKALRDLLKMMERIASTTSNVLVIGESGTGKELVARQLHDWSDRAKKAFVAVNCGAIPENLIESELFGHKRGSFTGAVADKPGLFEVASGGTLFLDEIGELPLSMQVKLLRAIQSRTIRRVGGNDDQKIDVRLIAATNRNLEKMVAEGTFREDLYYRLNVLMLTTPPLRERVEDIPILVEHFFRKCAAKFGKELQGVTPDAMRALESYSWPGNVRELENQVERAVALETETKIRRESFLLGVSGESKSQLQVSFTFILGEEELENLVNRFREFAKVQMKRRQA